MNTPFRTEFSKVSYSLHMVQVWPLFSRLRYCQRGVSVRKNEEEGALHRVGHVLQLLKEQHLISYELKHAVAPGES